MTHRPALVTRRWLVIVISGSLLLFTSVSLRQSFVARDERSQVYLSRASGREAPGAQAAADLTAMSISGPYTDTVPARSFDGDVRRLPPAPAARALHQRPELEQQNEETVPRASIPDAAAQAPASRTRLVPSLNMPSANQSFPGLSFGGSCTGGHCGSGWPPDTNGDVGPNDYIQTVNTSIGIFSKTGTQLAAFNFTSQRLYGVVNGRLLFGWPVADRLRYG